MKKFRFNIARFHAIPYIFALIILISTVLFGIHVHNITEQAYEQFSIDIFKDTILFLFFIFTVSILYVLIVLKPCIEKIFIAVALPLGLFYLITITPLSPPDESHHYQSAYQLSNVLLFQWDKMDYGNSADFDYSQLGGHKNVKSGYLRILNDIDSPAIDGEQIEIPKPRTLTYFVEYLPQAFGISIARITNMNFILTFFLGRLCNLLFYTLCVFFALKNTPKFKTMFFLLSITPMSLHQAASYSYDGFINGISFLLIALLLKGIYEEGMLSRRDYVFILILGSLLTPAKIVYWPILLLFGLIPVNRFKDKKDKLMKFGIILIVSLFVLFIFQFMPVFQENPPISGTETSNVSQLNWEGQYNYTFEYILKNPIKTAEIFLRTFWCRGEEFFIGAFGALLSGLSLPIANWIIYSFIFLVFLSSLNHEDSTYKLSGYTRGAFLLISVMVSVLILLSMFLFHTSNTNIVILGVQGRYFIPILPLIFMSLNNQTIILRKDIEKLLIFAGVLLHGPILNTVFNYTMIS